MNFMKLLGRAFKNLACEAGRKIINPRSLLCPHPCVIAKHYPNGAVKRPCVSCGHFWWRSEKGGAS